MAALRGHRLRCAVVPQPTSPCNPLDRVELGKSVEGALLARPLVPLPPVERFTGAGLYAVYDVGEILTYTSVVPPVQPEGEVPIYVGRARPMGARQGAVEVQNRGGSNSGGGARPGKTGWLKIDGRAR